MKYKTRDGWPKWTVAQAAYLAGIIDGEGSISLQFSKPRKKGYTGGFSPCVRVSNTDRKMIDFLERMWPRTAVAKLSLRANEKHKPIWDLMVRSIEGCRIVLERVLPYLITKREHAKLLLRYCRKHKTRQGQCGPNRLANSPPIPEWEWSIYNDLKRSNRRGVA